jgi:hypothetical protein
LRELGKQPEPLKRFPARTVGSVPRNFSELKRANESGRAEIRIKRKRKIKRADGPAAQREREREQESSRTDLFAFIPLPKARLL